MVLWTDFIPELVGSFFGAFLGYLLGVRQERKMRKEEDKEKKAQFIEALINEIEFNIKELDIGVEEKVINNVTVMNIHRSLYTYSFDSGINSGKYSTLSPHMQKELSIVYSAFKQLNKMRNIYQPNMSHEQLKELSQGIETLYKNMKIQLPNTISNLISEIIK